MKAHCLQPLSCPICRKGRLFLFYFLILAVQYWHCAALQVVTTCTAPGLWTGLQSSSAPRGLLSPPGPAMLFQPLLQSQHEVGWWPLAATKATGYVARGDVCSVGCWCSRAYSLTGQLVKCSHPHSGLCQAGRAQGACPRALREGTVKPLFEQLGQRVGFSADNSP